MARAIRSFHADDDTAGIVTEVMTNGVAIIKSLFDPSVMDLLLTRLEPDLNALEPGGGDFFGNSKRSVTSIFARGAEFSEHLLLNDKLLEIADQVLLPDYPMSTNTPPREHQALNEASMFTKIDPKIGPNCHHYRLNATVAMQVCPGGDNQIMHRDEWRYLPYMHRDPDGPELTVAFMVALTDFTTANGATRFVPGSNSWRGQRRPEEHEVTQATMPRGSVSIWLGSVFHGLGTNTTSTARTGIIFSYGVDHLTQEENQFIAVPPEIAFQLPRRAQALIGYRSSYGLNFIEGLDDGHVLS